MPRRSCSTPSGPERQPQNEWIITFAVELGKVLCELDPESAPSVTAHCAAAGAPPALGLPPLSKGAIHTPSGEVPDPLAGTLSVQGVVAKDGREGRFDDVVGHGWSLIAAGGDLLDHLDDDDREVLRSLDVTVASLDPEAPGGVRDIDGRLDGVATRPRRACRADSPRLLRLRQRRHAGRPPVAGQRSADAGSSHHSIPHQGALNMADSTAVIHPKFHHFNLKTTRLQEMIDFYAVLVGAEVNFQDDVGSWLSNDEANHRIALLAFPGFSNDPERRTRAPACITRPSSTPISTNSTPTYCV